MTATDRLVEANAVARLVEHDPTLFSQNGRVPEEVADRMGWTRLSSVGKELADRLAQLAEDVRNDDITDIVVIGMGGSSLASLVVAQVIAPESPRLHVLDTVSPATVNKVLATLDPAHTVYVISSKSGGTVEPNALYAVFRSHANEVLGTARAGRHFIAITDPGSSLERLAKASGFRSVVQSPPDIGGRFSALTVFGLVPAALAGVDIVKLLERGSNGEKACVESFEENPAVELAAFITDSYDAGADKLSIVTGDGLRSFALWVEQLVAESLGKQGKGILPVAELTEAPTGYGQDRAICVVRMTGDRRMAEWAASQRGVHPVYEIVLDDAYDIAEEFVRWEYSIALTGFLLGVNPFDQPNVAEAKAATSQVLNGKAKPPATQLSVDGFDLTYSNINAPSHPERSLATALGHVFSSLGTGDYVALLAYLPEDETLLAPLADAVPKISAELGVPVCLELGPRYLHSTGQLHKGGPNNGVFVMITSQDVEDTPVADEPWTLRTLHRAQAEGDLIALCTHDRRAIHIDLPSSTWEQIDTLAESLMQAVGVVYEGLKL